MCVAGHDGAPDHARRILALAEDMLAACNTIELPRRSVDLLRNEPQPLTADFAAGTIRVRIGVHSGPAFAGVVGDKMPRYWHVPFERAHTYARQPALSRAPLLRTQLLRRHDQHGQPHGVHRPGDVRARERRHA
jgi:hypothetical protein